MIYSICKKCGQEVEIFEINDKQICYDCELEIKSLTFWERYEMWKQDAFEEFVESEYYNGETMDDIGIHEDGSIHFEFLSYIKDVVTPFSKSIYDID